jgi:HEAT repeat protein
MFKMALTLNSINKLRQIINNSDLYNRRKRISAIRKLGNLRYTDADGLLISNKLVKPADAVEEQLFSLLVDKDSEIRRAATKALGKRGKTEFAEIIHGDAGDFSRLGTARDPHVFGILVNAKSNRNLAPDIRKNIDDALAGIFCRLDTSRLIAILNIESISGARSIIVSELGSRIDAMDIKLLEKNYWIFNYDDRIKIIEMLANPKGGKPKEIEPALVNIFFQNGAAYKEEIVETLATLKNEDMEKIEFELYRLVFSQKFCDPFEALAGIFEDSAVPENIQIAAISAMPKMNDPRVTEFLEDCLADAREDIVRAAACALAEMGIPQWRDMMLMSNGELASKNLNFRIASSGEPRAFKILSIAYSRVDYVDRKKLIKEVAAAQDNPKLLDFLVARLQQYRYRREEDFNDECFLIGYDYYYDAEFICPALASLKDPRALEPLLEALEYHLEESPKDNEDQWQVRSAAAKALGLLGDKRAVDALKKAKKDRDFSVSSAANISLEALMANKR